ncbi:MAG: CDP-diacylglycerol--serine O-phosphatidyltransferase [bacterium]|nr:CDP-diacylglycerol--serine O-phosphatidyltransferase [bacterium]
MATKNGRTSIKRKNMNSRFKRKRRVNMAKLTKVSFLPSIFTIFGLFLGYLALMQIINGKFVTAVYFIAGSVIMDGFDGTVARLTKTESNFGVQLDSLVDAVTFGLVISVLIYVWGFKAGHPQIGKVIGFMFLSAGVIRLARYNVLKEVNAFPSNVFIGLPIPLGALSICSVVLMVKGPLTNDGDILAFSFFVMLVAFLMISTVKYRTLKKIKSKYNLVILFILAIIVALSINFPNYTIPAITLLYMTSPVFYFIYTKLKRSKPGAVPDQPPVNEKED